MQGYCDVYESTILKRTSPELNVYMRRHQGAKCARRAFVTCFITTFHTAPLSTRSMEKKVNVMLKFRINRRTFASVSNKLLTDCVVVGRGVGG